VCQYVNTAAAAAADDDDDVDQWSALSQSHDTKHKVPGRGQAVVYAVLSVCC